MEIVCSIVWKPRYKKLGISTNYITRSALYGDQDKINYELIFFFFELKTKLKDCLPIKIRKTFAKLCNLSTLIHNVRYEFQNNLWTVKEL